MIPHSKKIDKGGDDYVSISTDGLMFCLADGVGGWAKKGIDPGLHSQDLCHKFTEIYEN